MDIIQCYAPTNNSDDQDKEEFYSRLLTINRDLPERNVIIVMGGYEEIMGQQGLREINDNGKRFADQCATIDLIIGGSFFWRWRIRKATWVSPDLRESDWTHVHREKIPGITLQDVRVRRWADVPLDLTVEAQTEEKLDREDKATFGV